MALTFGFTGMDPATEAALRAAFEAANARLGQAFTLVPDHEADHVVVDMDSMYGPMSWLRLHGAGKTVIGLTSAPRTQTDFRLPQPFDAASVAELLAQVAAAQGVTVAGAPAAAAAAPATAPTPPPAAVPSGMTAAPQPQDVLPEEAAPAAPAPSRDPVDPVDAGLRAEPASAAAGRTVPAAPTVTPAAAPSPTREPDTLADWLASGRLAPRVRLERAGQVLLIDTAARQYIGPATLKPITDTVRGSFQASDFTAVSDADWNKQASPIGAAHPLTRLLWFAALAQGQGTLMPGFDAAGQFRMTKWPQTEREFPKHFRIATAMMKGPATLPEIAEASGVPQGDVADFVNANLATGFAEPHREAEPEPEAAKSGGGLFGRLRGR